MFQWPITTYTIALALVIWIYLGCVFYHRWNTPLAATVLVVLLARFVFNFTWPILLSIGVSYAVMAFPVSLLFDLHRRRRAMRAATKVRTSPVSSPLGASARSRQQLWSN